MFTSTHDACHKVNLTALTNACIIVLANTLLIFSEPATAKDNIYSWQSSQHMHFTDIPPKNTHYQLHVLYLSSLNKTQAKARNTSKQTSSAPSKKDLIKNFLSSQQEVSTFTYCENIRKILSLLNQEKAFSWDINTQQLVKKTPKRKLIKSLQKELLSHCRRNIELNFSKI